MQYGNPLLQKKKKWYKDFALQGKQLSNNRVTKVKKTSLTELS